MKRIAAFLVVMGAAALTHGVAAQAETASAVPPTLTLSTTTPAPGAPFTATVNGCLAGEPVNGSFQGQTPSTTCSDGGPLGFAFVQGPTTGTAVLEFTAPTAAGPYDGTVTLVQSEQVLPFTVTVAAPATTTTTTLPTDTTTTLPPDTIATTTLAPPTTNPTGALPGTGSDSSMTITIAIVMLVAGVGLFVVANVRRRQVAGA